MRDKWLPCITLLLTLTLVGACAWLPGPPTPGPTPEPTPDPWTCELEMPECGEAGQTCSTPESPCWHNPTADPEHCEVAPACPAPDPDPDPDPPSTCDPRPQARIYWYSNQKIADATPAQCGCQNCDHWQAQDGSYCYEGRYCCPVGCEDDPERGQREIDLMGGTVPVWQLQVTVGNLRRGNDPGDWKFRVAGTGKGNLRWCFANGKACSKWLEVDR